MTRSLDNSFVKMSKRSIKYDTS